MNTRWVLGAILGSVLISPTVSFGDRVTEVSKAETPVSVGVTSLQPERVIASSSTASNNFVSCGIVLDTTKPIYSGDSFTMRVYCQNKTTNEIIIRGTEVWSIGIVYGDDLIWNSAGAYEGPATGAYSDFSVGVNMSCPPPNTPGYLSVSTQYLKDNGYTIRIPPRATTYFASLTIDKIGTACWTLPPGDYLVEVGLHRVETAGGVFSDLFMSAPVKILVQRPPR